MGTATASDRTFALDGPPIVARPRWNPIVLWAVGTAALVLSVIVLGNWMPSEDPERSICLMRRLGLSCPGCGMTRAVALLLRGQWSAAVAHHPLAPLVVVEGLALWAVSGILILFRRWRMPSWDALNRWIVAHAILFFLVWIVRML